MIMMQRIMHTLTLYQVNIVGLGSGRHPSHDPWGKAFSMDYFPERYKVANQLLAGGFYGVLDGIQADQEFLKKIFHLQRPSDISVFSIGIRRPSSKL